ncbi:MAG: hypothetical protein C4326_06490 [Ignavibacteria bacterium]
MKHDSRHTSDESVKRGFETSDVDAKSVTKAGIVLSAGLMIAGILFSWALYTVFKAYAPTPDAPPRTLVQPDTASLPPPPRLQADPHTALVPFVRVQDSILASYAWVNKDAGIARIPIERAMELVVKKGLPVQSQ